MSNWRKTKCCGTCALFPLEAAVGKGGRIYTDRGGQCRWKSAEAWPFSVRENVMSYRPRPGYVRVLDGADCACWVPATGSEAK